MTALGRRPLRGRGRSVMMTIQHFIACGRQPDAPALGVTTNHSEHYAPPSPRTLPLPPLRVSSACIPVTLPAAKGAQVTDALEATLGGPSKHLRGAPAGGAEPFVALPRQRLQEVQETMQSDAAGVGGERGKIAGMHDDLKH